MKNINILPKSILEKLTTGRLLAYLARLQKCHDTTSIDGSNREITKDTIEWQNTYSEVKQILSTREHI